MDSGARWTHRLIAGAKTSGAIAARNRTLTNTAAVGVPTGLLTIAALHAAWALGWRWPGRSDRELAETVVGPGAKLPSPSAVLAVAGALTLAASLVGAATRPEASRLVRTGAWGVAGTLLLRGVVGPFTDIAGGLDDRYERLDLLLYSPLCLVLGAGAAVVAKEASGEATARRTV